MSEAKDTLLRLIALLRLIPRALGRIATITLLEKLKDEDFSVSLLTVQRDPDRLSIPFVRETQIKLDEPQRQYASPHNSQTHKYIGRQRKSHLAGKNLQKTL